MQAVVILELPLLISNHALPSTIFCYFVTWIVTFSVCVYGPFDIFRGKLCQ